MRIRRNKIVLLLLVGLLYFIVFLNTYLIFGIGRYRFGRITIEMPDNFKIVELYKKGSIAKSKIDNSENFIQFKKGKRAALNDLYNESFRYSFKSEHDIYTSSVYGKEYKIGNKDVVRFEDSFTDRNGKTTHYINIVIFDAFKTYIITFEFVDKEYFDIYNSSIDTIKIGLF